VARAKTLTGLFLQYLRTRWAGLGRTAKIALVAGLVLAGAAVFQLGACMFGACPASGPCGASQSPCSMEADADEPCPYSGARLEQAEAAPAPADDAPPCHAD